MVEKDRSASVEYHARRNGCISSSFDAVDGSSTGTLVP